DRMRVAGAGRSVVEIDGQRHMLAAAALAEPAARDWRLLLVIPEDDLVGFVAANSRRTLLLSGGVVALAICLAGLLAYQGLVADRYARLLGRREQALAAHAAALDELAATAYLEAGDRDSLRRLTETVARALAARRVALWQLDSRHEAITCLDCYDHESNGHTTATEIRRAEYPELLEALERGEDVVVADAAEDPRTAGLARGYLGAAGSRSLLAVPIRRGGGVIGCIWIEDAGAIGRQDVAAPSFARAIAHLIGPRMAPAGEPEMA